MFEDHEEHRGQTVEYAVPDADEAHPTWIDDVRGELSGPGCYLVCMEKDEELQAFELDHGWNRIGRSAAADVRLDDPTVSRRHALVVWEPGEPLRVLDDRSLNGIFLNGELTDWGTLADGDELTIGRYRLFLIEV